MVKKGEKGEKYIIEGRDSVADPYYIGGAGVTGQE